MHQYILGMAIFSLFVVVAQAESPDDEEFQRLAKNLSSPAMSAAAFVKSLEKQVESSGRKMSEPCRTELQELMTKASVQRLEKTTVLKRQAQVLREQFNLAEARELSTFFESGIGKRVLILMSAVGSGQAQTPQDKQALVESLFSAEEWERSVAFLQSALGQTFQSKIPAWVEAQAKIEAEFERETMTILQEYSGRVNAIMAKYGY